MLPVREMEGVALRLRVGEAVALEQRLALRVRVTLSEPERDLRPLTVPEGEREVERVRLLVTHSVGLAEGERLELTVTLGERRRNSDGETLWSVSNPT